jgi:hypothetical protein
LLSPFIASGYFSGGTQEVQAKTEAKKEENTAEIKKEPEKIVKILLKFRNPSLMSNWLHSMLPKKLI